MPLQQRVGDQTAEDREGTLREVDDSGDPVDDHEAAADQREGRTESDPRDEISKELVHALASLPALSTAAAENSPR